MRKTNSALILALAAAASCQSSAPKATQNQTPAEPVAQAAGANAPSDSQLSADAQKLSLADQRKVVLIDQHLATSRDLLAQVRLDDALREADAALALDPDHLGARKLRLEILALKGETVGTDQSIADQMSDLYKLKVQELRAEAEDGLRQAKLMIARSDYSGAIAELEIVNNLVRFAPYSINWEGVDQEAKSLLESTKATRTAAEKAQAERQQREAFERLQAEEAALGERKNSQIANTIDRAISAFEEADYETSEKLAKEVLTRDPRNEQAIELRDSSFRAGRTQVKEEYIARKKEQFRRWQESLREMQIPWTDPITTPDPEFWNEITARRAKRPGYDISSKMSEGELALREQLRTTTIQMPKIADEESLTKVVDMMKTITGLPLIVDPAAEAAANGVVFNFSLEHKLNMEQALNLTIGMIPEGVTWTIKHDVVLVTTREKARGAPKTVNHDVQDLIFGLTDFIGPRINELRLVDRMSDDDGGGPFGGVGEKPKLIEPADLATLIQENVAVGTWQDEGISIDAREGYIMITHSAKVQEEVRSFLEDLRRFNSTLVTIESKFLTVSQNWIQEIGVDFRGLDGVELDDVTNGLEDMASRGLDNGGTGATNQAGHPSAGIFYDDGQDGSYIATTQNYFGKALGSTLTNVGGMTFQMAYLSKLDLSAILRAVEKSSNIELVNDQVLSVHNTQRGYVTVINQRAYIQDFDVEVAQFQAVADPQVNVLNEGVVLDVRPTIHQDRRYLTLEIQPTVAKVVALRDFSSTLGGNTSPVEFQLPEVQVQSVFTSAIIPDGGSIMLGGLSNVRNVERRAEVPWFAKIPIVGFFFKQEGYSDENKSLMILIRARITDVRDELKKIEAKR
jgi:hypothetical protein